MEIYDLLHNATELREYGTHAKYCLHGGFVDELSMNNKNHDRCVYISSYGEYSSIVKSYTHVYTHAEHIS